MPSNSQKTPIARSLNSFAQQKALTAISTLGKALPGQVIAVSGSIVTVKFLMQSVPNSNSPYVLQPCTMPIAGPQWARAPTQIGDQGVVIPADAYIGGVSGQGGVADFSLQANLSALIFLPVGSSLWSAPDDPNAWVLYGPDGVILRDSAKTVSLTVNAGTVTIKGNLTVTGEITAGFGTGDSVTLQQHTHGGVEGGSSNTATPNAGT